MASRSAFPVLGLAVVFSTGQARLWMPRRPNFRKPLASRTHEPADNRITAAIMDKVYRWGWVIGRTSGTTYKLVSARQTTLLDTSRAQFRRNGRLLSSTTLSPGTFVRVVGNARGTSFQAATVDVIAVPSRQTVRQGALSESHARGHGRSVRPPKKHRPGP